jgi:hypothetical protein
MTITLQVVSHKKGLWQLKFKDKIKQAAQNNNLGQKNTTYL